MNQQGPHLTLPTAVSTTVKKELHFTVDEVEAKDRGLSASTFILYRRI